MCCAPQPGSGRTVVCRFTFGIPVICDGTAQNNIGQSYSLASRNHTATAVNINFEGHSYHAAYVISGCDKTPTGILSGLAAADRARREPERGTAPVWAVFVPAHVLKGGSIPKNTRQKLHDIQDARSLPVTRSWRTTSRKTAATSCNVRRMKHSSLCSTVLWSMA